MKKTALLIALLILAGPARPSFASSAEAATETASAPNFSLTGHAGTDIGLVHAGDKLKIEVYKEPDLSGTFLVSEAGKIAYPLLGEVYVEGLSLEELRSYLTDVLGKDFIVNPQIEILLESSQNKSVAILGEVATPGNYILSPGLTLVRLVSQVGGFTGEAATESVKVVRTDGQGKKQSINVNVALIMRGEQDDFFLEPGDLIYVEKLPPQVEASDKLPPAELVTILGQVFRPGNYPYDPQMTVVRLIAQAGGFTQLASVSNVRIVRRGGGKETIAYVDVGKVMAGRADDYPLSVGDLVVVQESFF